MSIIIPMDVIGGEYKFTIKPNNRFYTEYSFYVTLKSITLLGKGAKINIKFFKGKNILNLRTNRHLCLYRKIFKILEEGQELIKMNEIISGESLEFIDINKNKNSPSNITVIAWKEGIILSFLIPALEKLVKEENIVWNQE